ncbi:heat shock factor protein-like isoform X1 [Schistocerca gregaria]|uniref:heat shock factor protein-like isoform X1 n=1 Tax=Schistocerca gregaria TaxID=7010 RepID=UPI00211E61CE|nr:heat shock factor protein-like isoform X1 [Schistocerca gregaria]
MHSIEELGTNVPAFLAKLWKMVEDPQTNDLISWSSTGTSFFIRDQARFARELLPLYYKHNNMASFVRQLNMYGFHKVVSIESGGLKVDKDEMEFAHQCFLMGHPYLLEHIKRKIPVNKAEDGRSGTKPELVNKVLNEVKNMKGRQDTLDSQLAAMKRENEVLWREVAVLRQKHMKQQQIVNKLIQFLVSMVQSSRNGGIGVKRHYPLMLNDITNRPSKSPKLSEDTSEMNSVTDNHSPTGPVIHELDPTELLDDCGTVTEEMPNNDFLASNAEIGEVRSPASPAEKTQNTRNSTLEDPDVLLELAEEYPLNPEILISVSETDNLTENASKTQKSKVKTESSKAKKRKSKLLNSLKHKTVPQKKYQLDSSVTLERVKDKVNTYVYENSGKTIPERGTDDIEISLVAANDAAISAISNAAAAAAAAVAKTETDTLGSSDCKTFVPSEPLNNDKVPPSSASNGDANLTLACAGNNASDTFINREELDSHLDSMQNDLDGLKELLKGEGYSLDANTLLGVRQTVLGLEKDAMLKLFGGDDLISYGIHLAPGPEGEQKRKDNNVADPLVSGSELMTYPGDILDFSDMCQSSEEEWILPGSPPDFHFSSGSPTANTTTDLATPSPQSLNTPKISQ